MRTFALLLVAGLLLAPQVGQTCTQINARDFGPGTFTVGDYIEITGSGSCGDPPPASCFGETLTTCYDVEVSSSCGGFSLWSGVAAGNSLSGTYRVDAVTGDCLKLCVCP